MDTPRGQAMTTFWEDKRVIVTGGAGFLGSYVVQKLRKCQAAEIIIPRSRDCDLPDINAVRRLLYDATHKSQISNLKSGIDLVIHLAARVGGIGANRAHPAEFFYDNLTMIAPLSHKCWQ